LQRSVAYYLQPQRLGRIQSQRRNTFRIRTRL